MKQTFVIVTCISSLLAHGITAQQLSAQERVAIRVSGSSDAALEVLLARKVTVQLTRVSLKRAIDVVAAQAKVPVQYRDATLNGYAERITLTLMNVPLGAALDRILAGTALRVIPDGTTQLGIVSSATGAFDMADGVITGTVVNATTKRPLAGAVITMDGTSRGATTDAAGMFRVTGVAVGTHAVAARMIGYQRESQNVTVADGQSSNVDFSLRMSTNILDQVVVTGTVVPTELKAIPSAITVITAKQIEQRGITKIDQLFRGDVPGLFAQNLGSGALLDEVTMFSRGATAIGFQSAGVDQTIGTTNPIKTYVDGIELADPKYLSQIDPKSIERIEILTGPQASTIYGSNAMNGVMQIFTKRGTSAKPQLTLSLLSGFVQNNFSNALTPQHDYDAQLNGVEGRLSYNAGGSWNYMGPWTPAKQLARTGGFGGARLELPTRAGRMTADMTLRRTLTQSVQHGDVYQTRTGNFETGWYAAAPRVGVAALTTRTLAGQTLGLTLSYAPASWWSHEFGFGSDASDSELRVTGPAHYFTSDTALFLQQSHTDRRSVRYVTTSNIPVTSLAQLTVTVGADAWQNLTSSWSTRPTVLTGTLNDVCAAYGFSCTTINRQPGHNAGSFVQTLLGIRDKLFLTYGLRAEWNPNFGKDAQPNYAPRYGVAYTQDMGVVTAKLRASYGRSTRPPATGLKSGKKIGEINASDATIYGNVDKIVANPDLGPEYQQGGEGGLDLYLGTRASLEITRYNQTVDALIDEIAVDSVQRLDKNPDPYGYCVIYPSYCGYGAYLRQFENLNIGSIRNQGWELKGSAVLGSLMTHGTYSWTKSRMIGITPKYRQLFSLSDYPQYQPGASFMYQPEHTWALGVTYARAGSSVSLDITGVGRTTPLDDDLSQKYLSAAIRLQQHRLNVDNGFRYVPFNAAYALADLNASHRFTPHLEGVLQVQNLGDRYANDYYAAYASLGRQLKVGVRVR